jgi:hypothetical protein
MRGPIAVDHAQDQVLLAPERAPPLVALVVGGDHELAASQRLVGRLVQACTRRIVQADLRMPAVAAAPLLEIVAQPRRLRQQRGELRVRAQIALDLAEQHAVLGVVRGRTDLRVDRAQIDRGQ